MTLALIAGRGGLPARVAAAQEVPPLVCAYEGCDPDGLKPDLTFRLETLGSLLAHLTAAGIREVCLCGAIDRPQLDPARLDARTAPLVPQFQAALSAGDNGALEIIKQIFEGHGMKVLGADALVPDCGWSGRRDVTRAAQAEAVVTDPYSTGETDEETDASDEDLLLFANIRSEDLPGIAEVLDRTVRTDLLTRPRATRSQTALSQPARWR